MNRICIDKDRKLIDTYFTISIYITIKLLLNYF